MNHLEDDAELYALGLTGRERDAEIEAHLSECDECRERVVKAEAAAASLAAALPPMPPALGVAALRRARAGWWPALATAAAVVFAFSTAVETNDARALASQMQRTDVALTAIASSHFGHSTLSGDPGVVAKAIYARDGKWCYVVANGAPSGAHVVMHQGSMVRDMGALSGGAPATLFVQNPGRADEIALAAGGRVVARGKPAYYQPARAPVFRSRPAARRGAP